MHPAETINTSTVTLRFDVYDKLTDKLIMSREETRVKEVYKAQRGVFGRIVKSFFKDFEKKVKKSR